MSKKRETDDVLEGVNKAMRFNDLTAPKASTAPGTANASKKESLHEPA